MHVFSIAAGAMISSGIFVLPALAWQSSGKGMLLAYFISGFLMLPALFSKLELATAIPKAGGTYFFVERILGTAPGVVAGLANWLSISLKSAFALVGIGAFVNLLSPGLTQWEIRLIAAGACLIFIAINLTGSRASGGFQSLLVAFLLIILVQFCLLGYRSMDIRWVLSWKADTLAPILATSGMVFISYGGLTKIASVAEEVKEPGKSLVRGAFAAFIIVQLLYLLLIAILIGLLHDKGNWTLTPMSQAAALLPFPKLEIALTAIAAILAFITTANAGLMAASRVPLSMSRDNLIPDALARTSRKKNIPVPGILVTGLFMIGMILSFDISGLAKVASLFMLLLFLMINLSVIVIRSSGVANYKPSFKTPLYPLPQLIGIPAYIILIIEMGGKMIPIAGIFIVLALLWYFLFVRNRVKRKSALVHMISRIAGTELLPEDAHLEKELLQILMEKSEIIEDRFDSLIRSAPVLDMVESCTRDEMFYQVSTIIAERWQLDPEKIRKKLQIREKETSTLIYPGVAVPHAIPHIVIEGTSTFGIVLVRNKSGIIWNDAGETVFTAFCLLGSKDERNFHLRALMAIAQILQDPAFHSGWMAAGSAGELRSTILLSKRKRDRPEE